MAKKINFTLTSNSAINMFSGYNVAMFTLRDLASAHREIIANLTAQREEILEARKKALEEGATYDEAIRDHSMVEVDAKIELENSTYKEACKPHKDALKVAYRYIPTELYEAFRFVFDGGNTDAVGTYSYKHGNKETTVTVSKSFNDCLISICDAIGVVGQDNESALRKFADRMKTLMDGTKSGKERYLDAKKEAAFKDSVLRVLLKILVEEKGVLDVNDDYTITRHIYE